ncbi:MAG: transposase, partial [Chloroflexi bacterium]|nr:transposase [Chloroflexota bacterium]
IQTDQQSIFGDYLYDPIVPESHFLRKLNGLVEWTYYTKKLTKLYKGEGLTGRPAYDPALLHRSLLISYLYDLSERRTEVYLNENLPAKWFAGLTIEPKAPDHSTLSVYRERLRKRGKLKVIEEMLREIIETAHKRGYGLARSRSSTASTVKPMSIRIKMTRVRGPVRLSEGGLSIL